MTDSATPAKKMNVGWFSFTCCEDSTILFTELLNKNLDTWKKLVNFKHLNALKTNNDITGLDVAFVEGAISSDTQASEVQEIRNNAQFVVAIGSCACTGKPSSARNDFGDEQINERIQWYLSHFDYSDKVKKLEEVIKVDDQVAGCPMNPAIFEQILTKYLVHFGIIEKPPEAPKTQTPPPANTPSPQAGETSPQAGETSPQAGTPPTQNTSPSPNPQSPPTPSKAEETPNPKTLNT